MGEIYFIIKINQSMVSLSVGAEDRPGNFTQYFAWIAKFAKYMTNIHVVGLAAFYVGLCGNSGIGLVLKRNILDLQQK
jgi:hypothetical protein